MDGGHLTGMRKCTGVSLTSGLQKTEFEGIVQFTVLPKEFLRFELGKIINQALC